ncbi:Rne/Rng family ribonuclease [Amnibacterium sp. CER49]|uniref:Rne/Rng family ribonuclease n=1 Tax=Amnibacterium sp. CER49 TaxID=3039161 RepID=UPI00244BEB74|nr:Rne/Rng family ribonuclease [Amnibacterium sp. CER49]MDH2442497.1 Rne/Rng family ribonuclease [Amnibacterium sp. CER49]
MVEYENDGAGQEQGEEIERTAPRRRRRSAPVRAADANTAPAVGEPLVPDANGEDEQGEQDLIVPPDPESTEPAQAGGGHPERSADEAPAEELPAPAAEADAPASGEPSTTDDADPHAAGSPDGDAEAEAGAPSSRPSLAVLFQAPPALPQQPAGPLEVPQDDDEPEQDEAEGDGTPSRRSRRRARKRSTGGQAGAEGTVTEVVPKAKPVRELITEPQKLKGSTRLEAKRQRRRDGRDAGRRRTVVTEAEFLARRESVDRRMIVRNNGDRIEIGVLEDGILAEHYVAKSQNVSLIGNVYLGRVQNVLPSMEAAFVDIGRGRNAVLYSGEVDWEAASDRLGEKGSQARRIELALKPGDRVLVQVTKDPIGHKGARLTSSVSLPGRYLVYVPNGSMNGISRKLPDTERARLKRILKDALPDSAGVIVRTAAEGATEEQLVVDVQRLANQWAEIQHLVETASAPALLHGEPDLLVKIVRDVFNEDFTKLVIQGDEARAVIERYLSQVAPDLLERVERWDGDGDVFAEFRVHEQIEKALDRKVWLPSGGSLVIDRTEAMTVIDVNTGKFVGSGGNLEETVTKNNLEAAEEIVRQLRLRDIGGIIVIDFIDMVLESNRDLVLRRLVECLSRDRTKHQVAEVTSLGLVQMTRKRLGVGLAESLGEATPQPEAPKQDQRRRRGGGQQQQQPAPQRQSATHAITDGAKTMLAQIAGATLANGKQVEPDRGEHAPEPVHVPEPATARSAPSEAEPDAPAVLLDLPVEHHEAAPQLPKDEAAGLLDSVLNALPAPKRPGEGRRRSRRVSTPALTPGQND